VGLALYGRADMSPMLVNYSAEYCPHHCLPVDTGIAAGLSIFSPVIKSYLGLIWWWKIRRFTYYCLLNDIGTATCFRQWR